MPPLELLPRRGIGTATFGMTPAEVRAAIREPEGYEEWMGGNLNDSLLFHGLICGFDQCDADGPLPDSAFRELRISVSHRGDITLWGRSLAEWMAADLRNHAVSAGIEFETGPHDSISSRTLGLGCDFDPAGRLEEIELWRTEEPTSRPAV